MEMATKSLVVSRKDMIAAYKIAGLLPVQCEGPGCNARMKFHSGPLCRGCLWRKRRAEQREWVRDWNKDIELREA